MNNNAVTFLQAASRFSIRRRRMDENRTLSCETQDLVRSAFPVVVSAPSGAGKTTLCRAVVQKIPDSVYSVSVTSRPQLDTEQEGVDYSFMTREKFVEGIRKNEFIEWTEYRGSYYGTPRVHLEKALAAGKTVVLDLDVYGARKMKEVFPTCITVYVFAPSLQELERRLRGRERDSDKEIQGRLKDASQEIQHVKEYDYAFVNEDFEKSVELLCCIIEAEKCRVKRKEWEQKLLV